MDERLARRGGAIECLRLPAWAFGLASGLRSSLYESGLLGAARAGAPVFSVGNITVGGTGKTPMVAWLARELQRRGRRVGWLARGYGAQPGELNDEARMLLAQIPGLDHVQGRDRVRGAAGLVERGVNAIVLDDGFQHRRLQRDVDFVLVDALRPWGLARDSNGMSVRALLPRGLLRENPRALSRADAIVLTRVDQVPENWLEVLTAEIEQLAPGVPRVHALHAPRGVRLSDGTLEPVGMLRDLEVDLISGIGNPEAFSRSVRALGALVREERRFEDHRAFVSADLDGLGADGRLVLCTAKDQVKLTALGVQSAALEIEMSMGEGAQVLEALIESALDADTPAMLQGRSL